MDDKGTLMPIFKLNILSIKNYKYESNRLYQIWTT